jgi:hypothetical protein
MRGHSLEELSVLQDGVLRGKPKGTMEPLGRSCLQVRLFWLFGRWGSAATHVMPGFVQKGSQEHEENSRPF